MASPDSPVTTPSSTPASNTQAVGSLAGRAIASLPAGTDLRNYAVDQNGTLVQGEWIGPDGNGREQFACNDKVYLLGDDNGLRYCPPCTRKYLLAKQAKLQAAEAAKQVAPPAAPKANPNTPGKLDCTFDTPPQVNIKNTVAEAILESKRVNRPKPEP